MNTELIMDIAKSSHFANNIPHHSHINAEQEIVAEIYDALEADQLDLPTLPDKALKIQYALNDYNVSAEQIVNLLSSDPSISVHIMRAVNSTSFSNGNPVSHLRGAISRLGYKRLHDMVMKIVMPKQFQICSPYVQQKLKELWDHSHEVAVNCYVLAQRQKHLKPEQAMLAGLVHDIGALPLYLYADRHHSRLDQTAMEKLKRKFSADIGTKLLQCWDFPDELVDVVIGHENLQRTNYSNLPDYVDVVTMANLQTPRTAKLVEWKNVNAAIRLGYQEADCRNFLATHADQLTAIKNMQNVNIIRR